MASDERTDELEPPWRLFWVAAAVAGVGVLWLAAPEAVRATFSSPATFARVAGVVVALVLFGKLVGRLVPDRRIATVIRLVPVVAVSWWSLSPYFGDQVVDEEFPVVAAAAPTTTTAPTTTVVPPTDAAADEASPTSTSMSTSTSTTTTTTPPEPLLLRSGSFAGLTGHRGNGDALVYRLPDGSQLLRLENLDVSNGPGLEIHLVPRTLAESPSGGVKLADLKGNQGNQNYPIPDGVDLTTGEWTALVWCAPFTVEVAHAPLDVG